MGTGWKKDFGRKDLIPFGIADMDFETLPEITRALTERAKHPTYGYTFPSEGTTRALLNGTERAITLT